MPKARAPRIAVGPSSASRPGWPALLALGLLALVLLALQFRLWVGKASVAEIGELSGRVAERQQENQRLRERNAVLEAEVHALKAGPESLEARARSDLGMIRKGETFFLIVPDAQGDGAQ